MTRLVRILHRAVVALLLLGAGVLALPQPAPADPPDAYAWWWDAHVTSLVPTPPPPTVPEGGLYVAGEPSGPFAIAALRLLVPQGGVLGTVTLRVASSQGTPAVRACPTEVMWTPELGGPMSSAPPYDCTAGSILAAYDEPSKTIALEVSPLVRDGVLNIVLAPLQGAVFQASFEKPGSDTFPVTAAPGTDPGSPTAPPDNSYFDAPAFTDTADLPAVTGGELVPGITPTTAASTTPTTAARARPRVLPRAQLARKATRDPDRVAAALVLMALAGAYMWIVHVPERAPQRIGSLRVIATGGQEVAHAAAPVVGRGIGRFRRPRTGPTPRL